MDTIHPDRVLACLGKISGGPFEKFSSEFLAGVMGNEFQPMGGMHDGGADGFQMEGLLQGKAGTFSQSSTRADHRKKIRETVKRLRDFGRNPKTLFYVTNRIVQYSDNEEHLLSEEIAITLRIRDGNWIANNINRNDQTKASFLNHLLPLIREEGFGAHELRGRPDVGLNVEACVFLSYEVDNRRSRSSLLESVTDSLILSALEETDPDKKIFLDSKQILKRILETFPFADKFVKSNFESRLKILTSKQNSLGREVRFYKKDGVYCLPYATRALILDEHSEFESLIYKVREQLRTAAVEESEKNEKAAEVDVIVDIAVLTLEATFKKEGLKIGMLATGADHVPEFSSVSDNIDDEIVARQLIGEKGYATKTVVMSLLRKAFYESTDEQRRYLQLLSRTYSLLFTLQYEPKVVEYFQNMRREFKLYVGSDILVRALSEFFVSAEDRMTTNMLLILKQAGSELFLTEFALEEIWTHIAATDNEFRNYYAEVEPFMTLELASQIDRILIRAYFYTKLAPLSGTRKLAGWKAYLENFCSYAELHQGSGRDQLRTFLCQKYGLVFMEADSIKGLIDEVEVAEVTKRLLPIKSREALALNDAQMMLLVYATRSLNRERYKGNPYGFSTWWLTHESRIQEKIADYVVKHGAKCIMRPEFLMYFVSMSPKMAEIDEIYQRVFPSLHGIKLGSRVRENVMHDLMDRAKKYIGLDAARVTAELENFSNKLKGDQLKRYEGASVSSKQNN